MTRVIVEESPLTVVSHDVRNVIRTAGKVENATYFGEACWIGEIYDKKYDWSVPHSWIASFTVASPTMRAMVIDKRKLHDYLASNVFRENMAYHMQIKDLWKTRRVTAEMRAAQFLTVQGELAAVTAERDQLRSELSSLSAKNS